MARHKKFSNAYTRHVKVTGAAMFKHGPRKKGSRHQFAPSGSIVYNVPGMEPSAQGYVVSRNVKHGKRTYSAGGSVGWRRPKKRSVTFKRQFF